MNHARDFERECLDAELQMGAEATAAQLPDLSLRAHVERLALAREEVLQRTERIKAARAAFEWTINEDTRHLESAKRVLDACESDVRGLALIAHQTTGNTKPCAGVSVVMVSEYAINEAEALVWARATGLALIPESLDLKAIKKIATVQVLPFVRVTQHTDTRIASDLTKALAEATS